MQAGTAVGNLAGVIAVRPEEAEIVAELKAGSEEAFAWLISTYHQPIYSVIARILQNPADAPDVTQDVFIKVFRNIHSFHGHSSLRTWLYRIALHEASNRRRWWSRHCRQEVTIEAETGPSSEGQALCIKDTLVDEHSSPFDMAANEEIRAHVEAALREVPEPFRTVLVLRDIEGFAYEEIAEVLNVHLGTVKSRLMRGRAQLKARLAPFAEAAGRIPGGAARFSAVACPKEAS
ncbi:MAG: sigma-70 family RNA polymerase sigma factor [Acidobacterium ailaaui]|nr:sigma-70 family RNA polymerase sigma factor [Pseudacidobacterium ailaaui]